MTATIGTREDWTAAPPRPAHPGEAAQPAARRARRAAPAAATGACRQEVPIERPRRPTLAARTLRRQEPAARLALHVRPDWTEGCPSCSFWADSFDGVAVHLAHRDVTLVCISRAPYEHLAVYRDRMGWTVPWYSSAASDFNFDFGVSFTADQQGHGGTYNFTHQEHPYEEMPGVSAFATDPTGAVFHTYSTYSRGLDPINSAYQLLDLAPKGRDEAELPWPMALLRRHDASDN